ncbi:hypothetical protein [Erwinia sp. 198]|uniref:hypothetical protein n=1 Tax=Erwinia sp. 198 TaxID=2022746 RepID=UPI000F69128E|nr:hypothetical protein [Erwinia sp. 198]RRZ87510.1 hypothetical protein EGK14_19330 [Erwinia sp. 198]
MRELNSTEVAVVSGAGKIQDTTTNMFGTLFSNIYKLLPLSELGYTADQVRTAGEDMGSRIGKTIETNLNLLRDKIIAALDSLTS